MIVTVWPPTVSVPVRGVGARFFDGVNVTVPFPEPEAPADTVSHDGPLVAVQVQPVPADTVIVPGVALSLTVRLVGVTVMVHAAADCVTTTEEPATVSVAVREVVLVFWAALKPNGPPPVRLAPDVMVSQVAGLVAVQAQPDVVVTVPLAEPPDAVNDRVVGDTEKEQGAPAWVTVTTFPAMVSAPDRDVVEALAEAEKVTEPLPLPLPPLAIDSQPVVLEATQVHPLTVATDTDPLFAVAATDCVVGETV